MKKRSLFLLLTALLLTLALLPSAAAATETPALPTGNWLEHTEAVSETNGVYEIESAEQLAWIAKQTAQLNSSCSGQTIRLSKDLDLSSHLWTPIGHSDMAFAGSFDGQGHTVKGLTITDDAHAGDYVGLFGYARGGSLQNVTLAEAYINVTAAEYVGSLVGFASSINNCHVSGSTVKGSGNYIGGLVGDALMGSIVGCSADKVTVTNDDDGFSYTGGLVGSLNNAALAFCRAGNVTVIGANRYIGGLVGSTNNSVSNCDIINSVVTGTQSGTSYLGGFAGAFSSMAKVANCKVENVNLTAKEYINVGGFCGQHQGSIVNSVAIVSQFSGNGFLGGLVGKNEGSITNCYAHVESENLWYGIAYQSSGTVLNGYYNNTATADFSSNSGRAFDCKAMTDDEMKADAFVAALNGYWDEATETNKYPYWAKDTANQNGGFPILEIPKVSSLDVIAPSFMGGTIHFQFRGENLDKVSALSISDPHMGSYSSLADAKVEDASRITASFTPHDGFWTKGETGYSCSGTVYLTLDGLRTAYPFSAFIPLEVKTPKVTSLSYADTLPSSGGVAEILLSGEHLASFHDTVTLTAVSSSETLRVTKAVQEGDSLRMRLALPDNIGESDKVYRLSVTLGSTEQTLPVYTLTVKAPVQGEVSSPFDLNGDGQVNVNDVIHLIRIIVGEA